MNIDEPIPYTLVDDPPTPRGTTRSIEVDTAPQPDTADGAR